MDLHADIKTWTVEQVKSYLAEAARIKDERPTSKFKLMPALPTVLQAIEDYEISGGLLKSIKISFFENNPNLPDIFHHIHYWKLIEDLLADPASALAGLTNRISGGNVKQEPATPDSNTIGDGSVAIRSALQYTNNASDGDTAMQLDAEPKTLLPVEDAPRSAAPERAENGSSAASRPRKRLVPQLVVAQPVATPSTQDEEAYMPARKLDIDEIFYGNTVLGEEIVTAVSDDEEPTFNLKPAAVPPATAYFYSKRMKFFLKAPQGRVAEITNAQDNTMTMLSYKPTSATGTSAMFYRPRADGTISRTRRQLLVMPDGLRLNHSSDFLDEEGAELQYRYPDTASLISETDSDAPTDAEQSDSSTVTENSDEFAEEIEDEPMLSEQEKQDIIAQAAEEYRAAWHAKLHDFDASKAQKEWRRMKGSRTIRSDLIFAAEDWLKHLEERLAKCKADLLVDYNDPQELRHNCKNLEGTIESIEQQHWKIDVYNRKQKPQAISKSHGASHGTRQATGVMSTRPDFGADDRLTPPPPAATPRLEDESERLRSMDEQADIERASARSQQDENGDTNMTDFIDDSEVSEQVMQAEQQRIEYGDVIEISDDEPLTSKSPAKRPHASMATPTVKTERTSEKLASTGMFSRIMSSAARMSPDSDSDSPVPKRPRLEPPSPSRNNQHLRHSDAMGKSVDDLTSRDIEDLDIRALFEDRSHLKLLLKMLHNESPHFRGRLRERLAEDVDRLQFALQTYIQSLVTETSTAADDHHHSTMPKLARIFMAWWLSNPAPLVDEQFNWDDASDLMDDPEQIELFFSHLNEILDKPESKLFAQPRSTITEPIELGSSTDDSDSDHSVPRERQTAHSKSAKKKKKKNLSKKGPTREADTALARRKRFDELQQSQSESQQAATMMGDKNTQLEINIMREPVDKAIYISERIAAHLKPHQVDGVQFGWMELTADEQKRAGEKKICGCILAHEMGLGKTVQTIAIMLTMSEAIQNNEVVKQLPKSLRIAEVQDGIRKLRVLVLLPPSLIDNWRREILQWARHDLGYIYTIGDAAPNSRIDTIEEWEMNGGVLLVGYEMFRKMVMDSKGRPEGQKSRDAQIVLEKAEFVVADEAHTLKNTGSSTHQAVVQLEAKHRLALTGTPLSNSIDEVFGLFSWIAPGYFGEQRDFNSRFVIPIKEGLYHESIHSEVRRSKRKLEVLRSETEPKCHRRGIEVLRNELPRKIEFMLTVAPTESQVTAYQAFVRAVSGQLGDDTSSVRIFSWLLALTLLLNHPWAYKQKLEQKPKPKAKPKKHRSVLEDEETGSDVLSESAEAASDDLEDQDPRLYGISEECRLNLANEITDKLDVTLSAKTDIFMQLVRQCLDIGDKILVFSGTLMTLDYLSALLSSEDISFGRIEGETSAQKRETLMKGLAESIDVLLISTRAGAYGYNMQSANRVIIFDSGFNPAHEVQAVARAYRIGQPKQVYVYRFICGGTFEALVDNLQLFKRSLASRVVDKKNPVRTATRHASDWLFDPKPVEAKDISEWMGKDSVLDHILEGQVSGAGGTSKIYAIRTMETLQADAKDAELDEAEKLEVQREIEANRNLRLGIRPRTSAATVGGASMDISVNPTVNPGTQAQPTAQPPAQPFNGSIAAGYTNGFDIIHD